MAASAATVPTVVAAGRAGRLVSSVVVMAVPPDLLYLIRST
jgi:hypothetical protein